RPGGRLAAAERPWHRVVSCPSLSSPVPGWHPFSLALTATAGTAYCPALIAREGILSGSELEGAIHEVRVGLCDKCVGVVTGGAIGQHGAADRHVGGDRAEFTGCRASGRHGDRGEPGAHRRGAY